MKGRLREPALAAMQIAFAGQQTFAQCLFGAGGRGL